MTDDRDHDPRDPITLSGEEARQGEIILRRRWQRVIFIAGLAGAIVLAVIFKIFIGH